jgi:hypothetical protein
MVSARHVPAKANRFFVDGDIPMVTGIGRDEMIAIFRGLSAFAATTDEQLSTTMAISLTRVDVERRPAAGRCPSEAVGMSFVVFFMA